MIHQNHCVKCKGATEGDTEACSTCPCHEESAKSPRILQLLCIFFGVFGAHRFYVGKLVTGLLMLVTLGGFGFWVLFDLLFIVLNKFEDKKGKTIIVYKNPSAFKKAIRAILAIIWGVVTVVVLFISLIFFTTSGMVDVVKEQLSVMHSDDWVKAYSYTSKDFQKANTMEQFKDFVSQIPVLTENQHVSFPERSVGYNNGVSTGSIGGVLTTADGKETTVVYQLIKEQGAWKIQDISINPGK